MGQFSTLPLPSPAMLDYIFSTESWMIPLRPVASALKQLVKMKNLDASKQMFWNSKEIGKISTFRSQLCKIRLWNSEFVTYRPVERRKSQVVSEKFSKVNIGIRDISVVVFLGPPFLSTALPVSQSAASGRPFTRWKLEIMRMKNWPDFFDLFYT